ncbi:MAG: hypothetical protein ACYSTT_25555, partial [Planctomycetota bacterium]
MKSKRRNFSYDFFKCLIGIMLTGVLAQGQTVKLDQRPAEPGEWGYRPAAGSIWQVNPPAFSWRPQAGMTWEIQCAQDAEFKKIEYRVNSVEFNVHCPPRTFVPGTYSWRYRGKDKNGRLTNWSKPRTFTIAS